MRPRSARNLRRATWLGRGLGALVLAGLLHTFSLAAAQPATDATLLLGVERDGRQESGLRDAVADYLGHNGKSLVSSAQVTLTAKDRECKSADCLSALAARERLRLVLSLSIQTNAPGSFALSGTLFAAEQQRVYQPPQAEVCNCTFKQLVSRLGQVADGLLKEYQKHRSEPAQLPPPASSPPERQPERPAEPQANTEVTAAPPAPVAQPAHASGLGLTSRRKAIAGVLGGVALGTLAPAIALTVLDGMDTSGPCNSTRAMPQCIWDNRLPAGILYATTAALAIGVAVTLFLPSGGESKAVSPPPPAPAQNPGEQQ